MTKRYVVVTSPERAQELESDLALATCFHRDGGTQLLIYRDNFVAYKVATRVGGQVQSGHIISGITKDGDLTLEDGSHLRLEHRAQPTMN